MNLRHNKPLNSYRGQANHDKNEINDDDFRQQVSHSKKTQNSINDQNYRYAQILAKFIKNVNKSYLQYAAQNKNLQPSQEYRKGSITSSIEQENQKDHVFFKKQQNSQIKQSNNQSKLQIKIKNKQIIKSNKKRQQKIKQKMYKQMRKNTIQAEKKYSTSQNSNKKIIEQTPKQNSPSKNQKNHLYPSNQNIQYINQNILSLMNQSQMNLLYNYSFSQNQYLINQISSSSSNLLNLNNLGIINNLNEQNQVNFQYKLKNNHYISSLVPKHSLFNQNIKSNTQTNLFNIQKEEYMKKQTDKSTVNKVYPLKRAAYHIAISYKIYLDKLQRKGVDLTNLNDIDPTKNAKKIKMRQSMERKSTKRQI